MMNTSRLTTLLILIAGFASLCATAGVQASSTMYFNAGDPYRRVSDSPFWTGQTSMSSGNFRMENFEDGLLNTAGVHSTGGTVRGPGFGTDSVDGDGDHVLDGQGNSGSSYLIQPNANGKTKAVFTFDRNALGKLPTFAGLVWTDGRKDAVVTFKAFDAQGNVIGRISTRLGDSSSNGTTAEDRFLGAAYKKGIAKIVIRASIGDLEIDHLQFGWGNFALAVVPLPPAAALGAIGLLGVAVWRRRALRGLR